MRKIKKKKQLLKAAARVSFLSPQSSICIFSLISFSPLFIYLFYISGFIALIKLCISNKIILIFFCLLIRRNFFVFFINTTTFQPLWFPAIECRSLALTGWWWHTPLLYSVCMCLNIKYIPYSIQLCPGGCRQNKAPLKIQILGISENCNIWWVLPLTICGY